MDGIDKVEMSDIDEVSHFLLDIPEYPNCKSREELNRHRKRIQTTHRLRAKLG